MTSRDRIIGGGQQLDDLLRTLPAKVENKIMRAALRSGAAVLLAEVKQRIPRDTGTLQSTARITGRAKNGNVTASVKVGGKHKGADAWYARLVEYGTRPHVIKPKNPGGSMHFGGITARSVDHPGTTARPFMRPSVDAKFTETVNAVREKIRERLTKQGLSVPAPAPMDPEE